MSIFSWFSSSKTVDNILDKDNGLIAKSGEWIGNLKLTDEEVIKHNIKTVASVQAFVKATLSENTERSKSRRKFAQIWLKMHVGIILMGGAAAPFDMDLAEFYLTLAISPMIAGITGAISIFHFGSHGLARHHESKKG